jgi:hypothetical protein
MPSAKQIEANRRNAQKSTGPRTDGGKRASSLNALKHGLTGQTLLMTPEESEAYEQFTGSIVRDLRPVGAMEAEIARSIADTRWRINRAAAIENNIFASEAWSQESWAARDAAKRGAESAWDEVSRALAVVRSFVDQPKRFQLLTTYEMRLLRKAQTELKQLRELQTARIAAAENAERGAATSQPQEAARPLAAEPAIPGKTLTVTASVSASQPYESAGMGSANGFVFSGCPSEEQIEAVLNAVPPGFSMANIAPDLPA